jgi:hypothetical protein
MLCVKATGNAMAAKFRNGSMNETAHAVACGNDPSASRVETWESEGDLSLCGPARRFSVEATRVAPVPIAPAHGRKSAV